MTLPTSWVVFNSDGSSMSISKLVSQGSGKAATIAMSVVVDVDMLSQAAACSNVFTS